MHAEKIERELKEFNEWQARSDEESDQESDQEEAAEAQDACRTGTGLLTPTSGDSNVRGEKAAVRGEDGRSNVVRRRVGCPTPLPKENCGGDEGRGSACHKRKRSFAQVEEAGDRPPSFRRPKRIKSFNHSFSPNKQVS